MINVKPWGPSVTVAAVIEHQGRYLLVEEHTPEGLRLNNPAGHLEAGESPCRPWCAKRWKKPPAPSRRTALVGVYLSRFQRPATGEDVTYLRFAYCGTVAEPLPGRALDTGIVRTLWLTLAQLQAEAARHRSPLVMQCIADHQAGRRHPLELLSHRRQPLCAAHPGRVISSRCVPASQSRSSAPTRAGCSIVSMWPAPGTISNCARWPWRGHLARCSGGVIWSASPQATSTGQVMRCGRSARRSSRAITARFWAMSCWAPARRIIAR
jgi:phosphatase NudJ